MSSINVLNQWYNRKSSRLMWQFLWSDFVKCLTLYCVITDQDRHHITWFCKFRGSISPLYRDNCIRVNIRLPEFGSFTSDIRLRKTRSVSFVKYLPTYFHTPVLIQVQHCNYPCYCKGNWSTWNIKKNPMVSLISDTIQIMLKFAHVF